MRQKMMISWCHGGWWSVSWFGLYPPVLLWKIAFSLLWIKVLTSLQDRCGGVLLFPSFFCELICYFVSPNADVCWYPLKNNTGRLSKYADVLCDHLKWGHLIFWWGTTNLQLFVNGVLYKFCVCLFLFFLSFCLLCLIFHSKECGLTTSQ